VHHESNRPWAERDTCVSRQLSIFSTAEDTQLGLFKADSGPGGGTHPPRARPDEKSGAFKVCRTCRAAKPRQSYQLRRTAPDGLQSECRTCKAEGQRARRRTPHGRRKHREDTRRRRKEPEARNRDRARSRARSSALRGDIPTQTKCEVCGRNGPLVRDHAHGYDRPNWSRVEWVCRPCDGERQRWLRTITRRRSGWAFDWLFPPQVDARGGGGGTRGEPDTPVSSIGLNGGDS
jgi:hypothetical protein